MRSGMITRQFRGARPGFAGFGLGSDPCVENFWSAACWFGSGGAQSLGVDPGAATISVTPPPISNCAGTLQADGTCVPVPQPNDPNNTTGAITATGGNIQDAYGNWVNQTTNSANVPQNSTAGTGYLWVLGIAAAAIFFMSGRR